MAGPNASQSNASGLAKTKKAAASVPPPPKATILSFFSKAVPVPAKSHSSVENAAIDRNEAKSDLTEVDVIDCDNDVNRLPASETTPQRPHFSPSKANTSVSTKDTPKCAKVVNLATDSFSKHSTSEKEDEDNSCVIMHSPSMVSEQKNLQATPRAREKNALANGSNVKSKTAQVNKAQTAGTSTASTAKTSAKPTTSQAQNIVESKDTNKSVPGASAKAANVSTSKPVTTCTSFFKPAEKKQIKHRERPQHPQGMLMDISEELLMVAQFASTFFEVLGIDRFTVQDLKADLDRPQATEALSLLHVSLLVSIVRAGDTPDEVRMIDTDTWPAVLREHLEDAHGPECADVREQLATSEYATLTPEQRLHTLCVLVDDCLQTQTIREYVDGSLMQIETFHREQQLDEIEDKYTKKPEANLGGYVIAEDPKDKADTDLSALTERQKARAKAKEEEEKMAKLEGEKRMQELRKQEEHDKELQRKQRAEDRARMLTVCADTMRVPSVWTIDKGTKYEIDKTLEHWSPLYPENDRHFQKQLREMVLPLAQRDEKHKEKHTDEGHAEKHTEKEHTEEKHTQEKHTEEKHTEEKQMDEAASDGASTSMLVDQATSDSDAFQIALNRAREIVLDLEARTPDDMFTDHASWRSKRAAWALALNDAVETNALSESMFAFELALKKTKMQEGWEEVRIKWRKDVAEARACATVMYLAKQLKVYIGKEKTRPGKLASVFAGNQRMTRSAASSEEAGHGESPTRRRGAEAAEEVEVRRSQRKRTLRCVQGLDSEDVSEEDDEDDADQGANDDSDFQMEGDDVVGPATRTRAASRGQNRKSQRTTRNSTSGSSRNTRASHTRSSSRAAAKGISYREDASDSDE